MKGRTSELARFDVFDFYRCAGAVLVVVVHFTLFYLPVEDWIKVHVYSYSQPLMGLFFTLSGFVIMHIYDQRISDLAEYTDYLQKRIARMYPLHIATLALAIFLGLLPGQNCWVNSGKAHHWARRVPGDLGGINSTEDDSDARASVSTMSSICS